jgi:hypothetical protein
MTNRKLQLASFAAIFILLFFSCRKADKNPYADNYSVGYFPLALGHYVEYAVDSTIWDDFFCVPTVHKYEMRYQIADTFRDNEFRLSYRVDVLIRDEITKGPWQAHRVIYLTPTPERLEYVEANVRFIKLVFPIADNIFWLGNSYIAANDGDYQYFQDWTYRYTNAGKPYTNGQVDFDNTVTVEQVDRQLNDPELSPGVYAEKTYGKEIYGYNIGLIYRETTRWVYDPGVISCRKGYRVVMNAINFN